MKIQFNKSSIQWKFNSMKIQLNENSIQWKFNSMKTQFNENSIQWKFISMKFQFNKTRSLRTRDQVATQTIDIHYSQNGRNA